METKTDSENKNELQPALLTIDNVCTMMNISRSVFYRLNASGKFAPLQVGLCSKVLYLKAEVEAWIAAKCPHRKQWLALNQFKDPRRHC